MPKLPDYPIEDQQLPASTSLPNEEEFARARQTPSRISGKPRRKNEVGGEQTNKEKAPKAAPKDVTEPLNQVAPSQSSPSPLPQRAYSTTSPVLTALGAASVFNGTGVDTTAWASNIPFSKSPPQGHGYGISLSGSPPDVSPHGDGFRGGFSNASPSTSPRAAYRLPVRPNNGYQSFGDFTGSSPGRSRPTSMPVQYPIGPPPPHHPQPHFLGAHEADMGFAFPRNLARRSGPGSFLAFDSLASSGGHPSPATDNVLLVAFERNLNIYTIDKDKLHVLGRLEGFRGEVIGAKILQTHPRTDQFRSSRPLVALIIHGPAGSTEGARPNSSQSQSSDLKQSTLADAMQPDNTAIPKSTYQYQTTVEVYSLRDQRHIATLFRSALVDPEPRFRGSPVEAPLPVGQLSLLAQGRFLVLSSGLSGEVYIFEATQDPLSAAPEAFKCLGKTWTSTPSRKWRSYSSSSASSEVESGHEGSPSRKSQSDIPVVSLSDRWLAIAPPVSSSRSTLNGTIDPATMNQKQRPPGLKSHSPPSQPQPTCELDTPAEESLFNRVARDVTQEVIKGAKWVGDQGMQAWKSYWNKPVEPNPPLDFGIQQIQQSFPPTHANDDRNRVSNHPALISILDLEKLSGSQDAKAESALHHVATFALPGGCSFVSLNPSGLSLLTASGKGDVQYVWDLMRMIHGKANSTEKGLAEVKPTVRQIARFTRMTVASIVDVVWTEPKGERLVVVTDRGTVHIFDLPANAFQWPPPRHLARPASAPGQQSSGNPSTESTDASTLASGAFSAAVNMVSGRAQPLFATIRGRPPNISNAITGLSSFNITAGAAAEAGAKGGKVVAAGISKSVGAATETVNTLRHLGENRLHIPGGPHATARGCARWLGGKDGNLLAVVGNGIVRIHDVRPSNIVKAGQRRPSVVGGKPTELSIPVDGPSSMQTINLLAVEESETVTVTGFWTVSGTAASKPKPSRHSVHPLSFAEIETNAPYQPFHTDHRINLHVYNEDSSGTDIHHLHDPSAWVFGEGILSTQITTGAAVSSDDGALGSGNAADGMENVVSLEGDSEGARQVVVTTRRRKGKKGEGEGEEGIFEDAAEWVEFVDERV